MLSSIYPHSTLSSHELPDPSFFQSHPCYMPALSSTAVQEIFLDIPCPELLEGQSVDEFFDFFVDPNDFSMMRLFPAISNPDQPLSSSAPIPVNVALPLENISPALTSTPGPFPEPRHASTSTDVRKETSGSRQTRKSDPVTARRERNRLAAERCRARKSTLITSLQAECELLRRERDKLKSENQVLMELLSKSSSSLGSR